MKRARGIAVEILLRGTSKRLEHNRARECEDCGRSPARPTGRAPLKKYYVRRVTVYEEKGLEQHVHWNTCWAGKTSKTSPFLINSRCTTIQVCALSDTNLSTYHVNTVSLTDIPDVLNHKQLTANTKQTIYEHPVFSTQRLCTQKNLHFSIKNAEIADPYPLFANGYFKTW